MTKDTALYPHEQVKEWLPVLVAMAAGVVIIYTLVLLAIAINEPVDLANHQFANNPQAVYSCGCGCGGVPCISPFLVLVFLVIGYLLIRGWIWD